MTRRLTLGYRTAAAISATPWLDAGEQVRGHEFHYAQVEGLEETTQPAWRLAARGGERDEGFVAGALQASFLHVHWAAFPHGAARFVGAARAERSRVA
jgi:cobyrinic acid a,c-diamide synthase